MDAFILSIDVDYIESRASKLHGAADPSRVDAIMLKAWHTRHGAVFEALRPEWRSGSQDLELVNRIMPKVAPSLRLPAVDQEPGARPLGCGKI